MNQDLYVFEEQKEQKEQVSLRDVFTLLFRHKYKMLIVFLATVTTVTTVTLLLPQVYEAQSTLLVKLGREYTYRPEVSDKAPVISVNHEEAINSEINIMTSHDLIENVVKTLQVRNLYPELLKRPPSTISPLDAAIHKFRKDLDVQVIQKTNVLQVTFQHKDRHLAAKAVNLLVEGFKEKHFQVYIGPESQFLEQQLLAYESRMKASQQSLQDFKQKNQVYSLDEQRGLLLKQRTELEAALKAVRAGIEGMQEKLQTLKLQMKLLGERKDRHTQTEMDKVLVDAKAQLLALQLKERSLLSKYNEKNGLIVNIRKDIAVVKGFLQQQEQDNSGKARTSNPVYMEVEKEALVTEAELNSELAKAKVLQRQLVETDLTVKSLDQNDKPLQNLLRDLSTNDRNYRVYLDKLEEAQISREMNRQKMANLSVIQTAVPPSKPVKPKRVLNIVLGFILGTVSSLGCAMLAEFSSQSICTPSDAQRRLQLPVLTTVGLKTIAAK